MRDLAEGPDDDFLRLVEPVEGARGRRLERDELGVMTFVVARDDLDGRDMSVRYLPALGPESRRARAEYTVLGA